MSNSPFPLADRPLFELIAQVADQNSLSTFVIGGYVRDLYLFRTSKDIDIVVEGSGIELAQLLAKKLGKDTQVHVFKNFGTAMLNCKWGELEFVGARRESYRANSRKPIVEDGSLEDDQNRRDFTINALALSLNQATFAQLVDPFDGVNDLRQRLIRTPLDPDITFSDDPLRMIRAVRFAAQLNFTIVPEACEAIRRNAHRMEIISKERIATEINKIIMSPIPSIGFYLFDDLGLLPYVFPQLEDLKGVESIKGKNHKDNFTHTLQVLDNIALTTDNLWLRWAALLHDIAKPATKRFDAKMGWTFHGHEFVGSHMVHSIFQQMKLPLNDKMKYVAKLVLLHLRPIVLAEDVVTDSAVRRLLFDAGDDVDDLMTLCEADITSKSKQRVSKYLNNFKLVRTKLKEIEEKDTIRNFQPPISGELIMKTYGLSPCREIGLLKNLIKEAILDGHIQNNFEEAYQLMLKEGALLGLKQV